MPQRSDQKKWVNHWGPAVLVCVALLLLRSWFFLAWEESYFNSDQAIVGLMAKHLAEGRARPLFFYGQEYMLAVEAWVAAPFIALLGPTVMALRGALVALNLATGLLLLKLLVRDAELRLWAAVAASSPFWIAPVVTSSRLVEAQGGNIEPFLWVLVLWMVRRRPLALGACLAIAFLNREFSMYALPMLAAAHVLESRHQIRAVVIDWVSAIISFAIVFTGVQALKPYADLFGPGTAGQPADTGGQDTFALAVQRVHWDPGELGQRFRALVGDFIPAAFGFQRITPTTLGMASDVPVGWARLAPLAAALAALALILIVAESRRIVSDRRSWLFPLYLIGIGAIAAGTYALTRPISPFTMRYGLLVLYVPIGLAAIMLHANRRPLTRRVAAIALLLLALCSVTDHVRVLARAVAVPPPAPMREIETRLEARGVTIAFADYWRAYILTYLSGETIKVVSTDFERIREYKAIAGRKVNGVDPTGVVIQREPCDTGGEKVAGWWLCDW